MMPNHGLVKMLHEALLDATAHLRGAASAYRTYASRSRKAGLFPRSMPDPFFSTRIVDLDNAVKRAHDVLTTVNIDGNADTISNHPKFNKLREALLLANDALALPVTVLQHDREVFFQAKRTIKSAIAAIESETIIPIDMILYCPKCGVQHIDAPDLPESEQIRPGPTLGWTNPPHRSHLCAGCGHVWRPADVATNGVTAIKTKGEDDTDSYSWTKWNSGDCPVTPDTSVAVIFRASLRSRLDLASRWEWHHDDGPYDIIAYRVIG